MNRFVLLLGACGVLLALGLGMIAALVWVLVP